MKPAPALDCGEIFSFLVNGAVEKYRGVQLAQFIEFSYSTLN